MKCKFLIFTSASIFLMLGISSCSKTYSVLFPQENLTMHVGDVISLNDYISTDGEYSSITYLISDPQILKIENNILTAYKKGNATLTANIGNSSDVLNINVLSLKPTLTYTDNSYDLCLNEDNTIDMKEHVSILNGSYDSTVITSSRTSGYQINGLEITIEEVGTYVFDMICNNDETLSDVYTFKVNAYETFNLNGLGTFENPYLISSASDLKELSESILNYVDTKGKYFKQTCDISLKEYKNWTPIGTFGIPFEGNYDGAGFKVSDININTTESWQGLFGFSSGVISNVTTYGNIKVGCHPDYVYSHSFAGGVVGGIYNNGIISNCVNYASVHGDSYVGGICGSINRGDEMIVYRDPSYVINCTNYGTITGSDEHAYNENAMYFGGVVGESCGVMSNNINYGEVNITGEKTQYVGGVCGLGYTIYKYGMYDDEDNSKYNNYDNINYGKVSGNHSVGGVFGANALPLINNKNYGEVSGDVCVGGVSGLNGTSSVYSNEYAEPYLENCYNEGKIYAESRYAGGITSCSYFLINNCVNKGDVSGGEACFYVGGICGYQSKGDVINSVNEEQCTIEGYYGVAGITGWQLNSYSYIKECVNKGLVRCLENSNLDAVHIGGIVGMLGSNNVVEDCINYGEVIGQGSRNEPERWGGTGGIAGSMYSRSQIYRSSNFGYIHANQQVGGVVGYISGSSTTLVIDCINGVGAVIGSDNNDPHLGGIIGRSNNGQIINCSNYGSLSVVEGATHVGYINNSNSGAIYTNNVNYFGN